MPRKRMKPRCSSAFQTTSPDALLPAGSGVALHSRRVVPAFARSLSRSLDAVATTSIGFGLYFHAPTASARHAAAAIHPETATTRLGRRSGTTFCGGGALDAFCTY